jgi:hypothetical protein
MTRFALVTLLALAACRTHAGADADAGDAASVQALAGGDAAGGSSAALGDAGSAAARAQTTGSSTIRVTAATPYISSDAAQSAAVTAVQAMANAPMKTADDCAAVLNGLDVSFGIAGSKASSVGRAPLLGFGKCARDAHEWQLLRQIGYSLLEVDSSSKDVGYIAAADEGYGRLLAADAEFADLLRKWPKDAHVYRGAVAVACRLENWTSCQKRVDQALGFARNAKAAADDPMILDIRIFKAIALLHTNKLDDASREVDAVAKLSDAYAPWKARFDEAKATKLWVDPELDDDVYPALLAKDVGLYGVGKPLGPMATVTLWNVSGHALDVKVTLNVDDVTDAASQAVHFTAQKATVKLTPELRAGVTAGDTAHPGNISLKIADATGYNSILERNVTATIHSLREMPTTIATGPRANEDASWKDVRELAAIRVAPTDPAVLSWIDAAKTRAGAKVTWLPDAERFPQVQALWDELVARKMVFGRDPAFDNDRGLAITVRTPAEVLAAGSGTTLEGSVLFASALEALNLPAVLVHLSGHALVGWLAPNGAARAIGSPVGNASFLDTSPLGHQPFEAAVLRSDADVLGAAADNAFDQNRAFLFLLSKLRKSGYGPLGN